MKITLDLLLPKIQEICDYLSDNEYRFIVFYEYDNICVYCHNLKNNYYNEAMFYDGYIYNGDEHIIKVLKSLKGEIL